MQSFNHPDRLEVGIDEAGRGPLLGRVYTAAVIWPPNLTPTVRIDDSKKLSTTQINQAYQYIKENALAWSIDWASEDEIDNMNILHATMKSMHRAIDDVGLKVDSILVDGNYFDPYFDSDGNPVESFTIEKGDSKFISIAAASILAKHDRDQYILQLCDEYPDLHQRYNLRNNKGYGAAAHTAGIKKYGICQFHRKSFKTSNGMTLNPVKLVSESTE